MYNLREIRKGLSQPYLIFREFNALITRRFGLHEHCPKGVDIFEQDWDNLIILDACRYDVFAERADLPGHLERRYSKASATSEFIRANFSDKQLHDTVYVAGNSWILQIQEEINAEVNVIYDVTDNSDRNKLQRLTHCARDAAERHPNKRLLVHYIPPHHPFVGPTADEHLPSYQEQLSDLFNQIQRGDIEISNSVLRRAYEENLDRVLPKVKELLSIFDGKTVVTADHGELLGERTWPIPIQSYSHPAGMYVDELVSIPWLVHETGERKTITEDEPRDEPDRSYSSSDRSIDDRLRDLGYGL